MLQDRLETAGNIPAMDLADHEVSDERHLVGFK